MKRKLLSVMLAGVMLVGLLTGCGAADKDAKKDSGSDDGGDKKIKIGMTLYSLKNEYTVRLANAAEAEAEKQGVELVVYDGNYDASTQISQVETMIADGCDGIILNPQDAEACSPCVDKAVEAGIPIVGVNTRVQNDKLTSYVGSIDVKAGEMEAQALLDVIGTDAKIVIIEGPMGQSAQIERREGIKNILDANPNVEVLAEKTANWSRSEAMTVMETWLQAFDNIDGVIGENDEMALGAKEAIKAAGGKDIPTVGVDGITDALEAVENGTQVVSIFQNADGQARTAVDVLIKAIKGETVDKDYWIDFEEVNKENVAEFKTKAQ
jgi:putative xylitol transport system substrate-binding protein/inositol transport system substrate-binding protein